MYEINEHTDLEEKFQISAKVEFSIIDEKFEGLQPMEIKEKKKKKNKPSIENVKLDRIGGKSGLF